MPTAKSWLSVLVASWQVFLLSPLHRNPTKRLVKTPKLYFLDTGLCAHLTRWSSPQTLAAGAMAGAIFDTWVVAEILKSWWHRGKEPPAWFYRDHQKREIDLVLEVDGLLHGVEVKRAATINRRWAREFSRLDKVGDRGHCAVACLTGQPIALDAHTTAIPVGLL